MSTEDMANRLWPAHKLAHNVFFESLDEEHRRMCYFKENHFFIEDVNKNSREYHYCRHNHLSHWCHEEYLAWLTLVMGSPKKLIQESHIIETEKTYYDSKGKKPPTYLNWKTEGRVTSVKKQGKCGGSWAFSATGAIESANAILTKKLITLSEQQLIDCSTLNRGCNGGLPELAFLYVRQNGQMHESDYPYEATQGTCRYSPTKDLVYINTFEYVKPGDLNVMTACATMGPLSTAVNASHRSFQFYGGGIYYDPHVRSYPVDHAVLLVGYGKRNDKDFWYVKNSWGADWGEQGYIYIRRNNDDYLGLPSFASGVHI